MAQREKIPAASGNDDIRRRKYIRRAVESAFEYNVFLNRQRQRVYMDLQTDTPNYPVGLGRQNKTLTRTEKVGRFPVAVMPSQYQDWFIEYTPEELQFLPVDTVLRGPVMRIDQLPPVLTTPDVSDFDSESESCCSTSSEDCSSCCSCCAQNNAATEPLPAQAAASQQQQPQQQQHYQQQVPPPPPPQQQQQKQDQEELSAATGNSSDVMQ